MAIGPSISRPGFSHGAVRLLRLLKNPNDFGNFLSHLRHKGQVDSARLYVDILRLIDV